MDREGGSKKRKVRKGAGNCFKLKPLEVTKSKVIHHRMERHHQELYKTDVKFH